MATHDYVISNQTAPQVRSDLNNALQAIVTNNSNASAPSSTFASMIWYDTATNKLYMRNEGDDAWIWLLQLDQSGDLVEYVADAIVRNGSGTSVGTLGIQASSNWTGGTVTTETLVSPSKVKAAVDAYSPIAGSSRSFVSSEQTLTAGSLATLAHGLGAVPKLIDARFICKTAHDIFSVGDELQNFVYINGSDEGGVVVWADATNVYCRQNSDNSIAYYNAAGSFARTSSAQTASFKLIVRAWV
jgi:hypothetical protein